MSSEELMASALEYETKIRDFYLSAVDIVDDDRGKAIFRALADDEQSHVDFLEYSLKNLKAEADIDISRLVSPIPSREQMDERIEQMKTKIPERMLGDVKQVLSGALRLEVETSAFYEKAAGNSSGPVKTVFEKFLAIERRHADMVQFELDSASNNGYWFNFMEIDMED